MRKIIVAANWKMHKNKSESVSFVEELKKQKISKTLTIICPTATNLDCVSAALKGSNIQVCGQDMYFEANGAFTGQVSASMIKDFAEYIMIGHSERRHIFGETDEEVNLKVKAALNEDLIPIVCVGEKLEERKAGDTFKVVERQLKMGLEGVSSLGKIIIAYEPVWAIGTGETATPEQAEEAHKFIRGLISEIYDPEAAEEIQIIYGGSVKPDNFKELLKCSNIDGGLVGGASLDIDSFGKLVEIGENL